MNPVRKESSLRISMVSFIAAILVVSIHIPITSTRGCSWFLEHLIGTYIAQIAVPFFFVVTGYFLGVEKTDSVVLGYSTAIRKRVQTILLPYLFWCIVLCCSMNLIVVLANVFHSKPLMRNVDFNFFHVFGLSWRVNPPQPLWYLRAIMFYLLILPIFRLLSRTKFSIVLVFIFLVAIEPRIRLFVRDSTDMQTIFFFTLAPLNLFSFMLGLHLRSNHYSASKSKGFSLIVLSVGVLLMFGRTLIAYNSIPISDFSRQLFMWSSIWLTLWGLWCVCPTKPLPTWLRSQAFPIYLMHGLFLVVPYAAKSMMPIYGECIVTFILCIVIGTSGSIILSTLMRRFFPRFARFVFGGR